MAEKLEFVIGAKDSFTKVFGDLDKVMGRITKLSVAAAGAIAGVTTALFAMTKQTAATNDALGKFSDRIGVSIEALSAYQHVAELSGVSQQSLNVGWQRMTRRISEATKGTGVAAKSLEELGIEIDNIAAMSPDQQFETIAAAMEGVSKQGDKVRLAMSFWDTEGVSLLQVIQGGSQALEDMKNEAADLGLVISDVAFKKSADFNDSLARMMGSIKGVQNEVGEKFMPVFTTAFNNIAKVVSENRSIIVKQIETLTLQAVNLVGKLLIGTARIADTISPIIRSVRNRLLEVWETFKGLPDWVRDAGLVGALLGGRKGVLILGGLLILYDSLKTSLEGVQEAFKGNIEWSDLATANHEELVEMLAKLGDGAREAADDLDAVLNTEIDDENIEKIGEFESQVRSLVDTLKGLFTGEEGEEGEGPKLPFGDEETEKTVSNIDTIMSKIDEWKESMGSAAAEIGEIVVATFEVVSAGIGMAVSDSLFEGAKLGESLKKLMRNVAKSVVATLIEMGVKRLILSALNLTAGATETSSRMAQLSGQTYAAAFAATAAIPVTGPALAPGVAAASTIAMLSGSSSAAAIGGGVGATFGIAHGGLDFVPKEQTFLLDRGERVLSPRQNEDLTGFLANQNGAGAPVSIENLTISILENATNIEGLLSLSREDWRDLAEDKILPAFEQLRTEGVVTGE